MILTEENIEKWMQCLSKEMKEQHDVDNYAACNSNKYWLQNYIDADTQDAIDEEIECWDEPDTD